MIYGRIAIDSVTSNGRLLAPYGYIFLGPDTPESQWTNVISARQSTLGFLFTGPNLGNFKTLARYETYFLSSVTDANVYGLAQYFLYAKVYNEDWAFTTGVTSALVNPRAPSVLNPSSGSNFGNLGFMRPQLRAERFLQVSDDLLITPQVALTSPVGTDFFQTPTSGPDGLLLGEETHHGNEPDKIAELRKIEEAQLVVFGQLLGLLSETAESGGSLLDHTQVLYGSCLGNANSHSNQNLPLILAGGGFKHGSHLKFDERKNIPLANLFVSMLQRLGIESDRFASSSGTLRGLDT